MSEHRDEIELTPEEAAQRFPAWPEWLPLSQQLVRDMETLPLEAIAICVWLSYRWWDEMERSKGEGRDPAAAFAASASEEIAAKTGLTVPRAEMTLGEMESRGMVGKAPEGWFLTRYALDVGE